MIILKIVFCSALALLFVGLIFAVIGKIGDNFVERRRW